jgi:hypothetical protein
VTASVTLLLATRGSSFHRCDVVPPSCLLHHPPALPPPPARLLLAVEVVPPLPRRTSLPSLVADPPKLLQPETSPELLATTLRNPNFDSSLPPLPHTVCTAPGSTTVSAVAAPPESVQTCFLRQLQSRLARTAPALYHRCGPSRARWRASVVAHVIGRA